MRAAIWYQGESDTWQPKEYGRLLQRSSRLAHKFGTDLPFVIVQLPISARPAPSPGNPCGRKCARCNVTSPTRHRTLAGGDHRSGPADNIHPTNKAEVGRRLALVAERLVYGMNVADSGADAGGRNPLSQYDRGEFRPHRERSGRSTNPNGPSASRFATLQGFASSSMQRSAATRSISTFRIWATLLRRASQNSGQSD